MNTATIRETLEKAVFELNPKYQWPVNLHDILSRLGIGLSICSDNGKRASYLQLGQQPKIVIYQPKPELVLSTWDRFSIAHELAHWVVWRRFGSVPSSESEYWWHETLCNEFAAQLLVPRPKLRSFLRKQYDQGVDPIYFPLKVARFADVSWPVAAKSVSAEPTADAAYLRLIRLIEGERAIFKVNCSTLSNMPGSFVGRSALIREEFDLPTYLNKLSIRKLDRRVISLSLGALDLNTVPCSFLREPAFWVLHFRPSEAGVKLRREHATDSENQVHQPTCIV